MPGVSMHGLGRALRPCAAAPRLHISDSRRVHATRAGLCLLHLQACFREAIYISIIYLPNGF